MLFELNEFISSLLSQEDSVKVVAPNVRRIIVTVIFFIVKNLYVNNICVYLVAMQVYSPLVVLCTTVTWLPLSTFSAVHVAAASLLVVV